MRSAKKWLVLVTVMVLTLSGFLSVSSAYAYDLLAISASTDTLYRFHAQTEQLKGLVDLTVADDDNDVNPLGVYVGPRQTIYVASRADDSIIALDKHAGKHGGDVRVLVQPGSGELNDPFYIIERDGLIYVSSRLTNEIKRYDAVTGAFVDNFVKAGSGGLNKPRGIRFGPDGYLYVNSSGTDEVKLFDGLTGVYIETVLKDEVSVPCGLAFDVHGHMCVASAKSNTVDPNPDPNRVGGVYCYDWATMDRIAQIEGNGSCGLDFGPEGHLYLAFTTDEKIGVYSLQHDKLKIIDDIPTPRGVAVWPRSNH